MPRHTKQNQDRPIFGAEQEADRLGAIPQVTDDFDFDPSSYAGPLGMPIKVPGFAIKWVAMTNPENGQDDPREVMKHRSPALGMWDFVRPEEVPDFAPLKMTHGVYGGIIATQGMCAMKIPEARRQKLVDYFDSLSDRQVEDIKESGERPAQQDSRSPFTLKVGINDPRMRQPTIRE